MQRKRYALVGCGGRAVMFVDAIAGKFTPYAELVGLCDVSPTRMNWHNGRLSQRFGVKPVPTFLAEQFDEMIRQTRPDVVIVCTIDCWHHHYIIRAMELGCDVICEKPLTIDAPKATAIREAIQRTGRNLRVTFNYRYSPGASTLRKLMQEGAIGTPLAVDFSWVLDTNHGADYFRRWHREKDKSGGLLVHKATHHFDLVNWLVGSVPKTVFAMGDLKFYGRANAERRGERYPYSRYTGEPSARQDPFALFLDTGKGDDVYSEAALRGLYLEAEKDSGYIRDRNVFGDGITIEDTMAVLVCYRSGVIMNYSLIAYSPWEGFRLAITGDKGRIEYYEKHGSHIIAGQSDDELAAQQAQGHEQILMLFPMFGVPRRIEVPRAEGGHGGSDPVMLEHIFLPNPPPDPLQRAASYHDGVTSLLVGISANESIRTGQPVECAQLIPGV